MVVRQRNQVSAAQADTMGGEHPPRRVVSSLQRPNRSALPTVGGLCAHGFPRRKYFFERFESGYPAADGWSRNPGAHKETKTAEITVKRREIKAPAIRILPNSGH